MKINIPLGERNRYVDLMGDPIHQNKIASTLLSEEFAGAVLASGTAALLTPDDPLDTAINFFQFNAANIFFNRFFIDKLYLGRFDKSLILSRAKLNGICIDKNPDPQQKIDSTTKYGSAMRSSAFYYGLAIALTTTIIATKLFASHSINALNDVSDLTRKSRGLYRSLKLLSGEWAIVTTPNKQEKIKDTLTFEIPDIKLPSPVPQPAREML